MILFFNFIKVVFVVLCLVLFALVLYSLCKALPKEVGSAHMVGRGRGDFGETPGVPGTVPVSVE